MSRTHPVREKIVRWRGTRGVIVDASPQHEARYWWERPDKVRFFDSYRDITPRSKFILCPHGISSSTIRVFESMEVGAVPVIIAYDIELPLGPDWETFALRVAERDIDTVPRLIERWEDRAGAMGSLAHQAWERYFSPQATFGSVAGWGLRLLATPVKRPAALWFEEHSNPRRWLARLRRAKRSRSR
ncbi:MAG TPA: exostosin family protein [Chthoniobacterales bacterium]|jgi:hypothetical protein